MTCAAAFTLTNNQCGVSLFRSGAAEAKEWNEITGDCQ